MHKMQHITGKEIEVMGYFYKKRKGHVRQIKKELNLSEHTLLKCLASLKRRNIVESNKEGNLKVYNLIPKHPLAKILFSYFDFQRFEGIEYNRKKAIQEFCDCAKNIKLPYFMLLFGSTAKETYNKKSDVDLIIVYDDIHNETINQLNEIRNNVFAERNIKINTILMKLNEFRKELSNNKNFALHDAIKTGYSVFGNQLYYELILNGKMD